MTKESEVSVYFMVSSWVLSPRSFFYLPWVVVPSTPYSKFNFPEIPSFPTISQFLFYKLPIFLGGTTLSTNSNSPFVCLQKPQKSFSLIQH
jgi:hypothetical protein